MSSEEPEVAIRAEGLAKRYRLSVRPRYKTLRESLMRLGDRRRRQEEIFWALRDVSFTIRRGDTVGILGRNGAGKSTLLKILSRITEPTEGRAEIHGRVGSLLEVGTGFHQELTGRENVYLNGAILGMKKAEIDRKLDEIVAFAEVERFLDTPVKWFSSGMGTRLAFAVAAHLEAEILLVDEVLAVGDVAFQRRCLGKMGEAARSGRTVLLVSHNMMAIQQLCTSAIVLDRGRIVQAGSTDECVRGYLAAMAASGDGAADLTGPEVARQGNGRARFTRIELLREEGGYGAELLLGEPLRVRLTLRCTERLAGITIGFLFLAADGAEVMGSLAQEGELPEAFEPGLHTVECAVRPMLLTPGRYSLRGVLQRRSEVFDRVEEMARFEVLSAAAEGAPVRLNGGYVHHPYLWRHLGDR
jgi:lipopolysaccharide transport system ATP-binding protein